MAGPRADASSAGPEPADSFALGPRRLIGYVTLFDTSLYHNKRAVKAAEPPPRNLLACGATAASSLCRRCCSEDDGRSPDGRRALVRRALFSPARKTPCSPKHLRALCTPGTHSGIRKGDERTRDVRLTELPCLNRF